MFFTNISPRTCGVLYLGLTKCQCQLYPLLLLGLGQLLNHVMTCFNCGHYIYELDSPHSFQSIKRIECRNYLHLKIHSILLYFIKYISFLEKLKTSLINLRSTFILMIFLRRDRFVKKGEFFRRGPDLCPRPSCLLYRQLPTC